MEKIKIKNQRLEDDIQPVLNKVDSYSNYGRTPTYEDRLNQPEAFRGTKNLSLKS